MFTADWIQSEFFFDIQSGSISVLEPFLFESFYLKKTPNNL